MRLYLRDQWAYPAIHIQSDLDMTSLIVATERCKRCKGKTLIPKLGVIIPCPDCKGTGKRR